jgi:cell division protein FtsQ
MAKRLGVNSRKKNAARKVKVRSAAKKITFRSFVVGLIIGIGVLVFIGSSMGIKKIVKSVKESDVFDVNVITVQGNNYVTTKNILDKCGVSDSSKTYSVKESSVRSELLTNPWIENVKVAKKNGGKMVISIVERKPIAMVNLKSIYYIDKYGVLFPLAQKVISEMPVVCGLKDTIDSRGVHRISNADMVCVKQFLHKAAAVRDDFLQSITQIDFTDKEKIRLSFQAYSTVVELDQTNLDIGLRRLVRLRGLLQNNPEMPEKINLCYHNLAFVTNAEELKIKEPVQAFTD